MHSINLEGFLGRTLEIPASLRYDPEQNLWVRQAESGVVEVGFCEPLILSVGGIKELEPLVDEGSLVQAGDMVLLAITAKIRYLHSPLSGTVSFNPHLAQAVEQVVANPYDTPLFSLARAHMAGSSLASAQDYVKVLSRSEGARNPGGHVGAVSPTCKGVYQGISGQRLSAKS